jgi:hypothetical protein
MKFLLIVFMGLFAAISYGIVHDLFTANVCVEYFTIGHRRLIPTENAWILALFWGIVATWWVGLPLGCALGLVSRIGQRNKVEPKELIRPIFLLLTIMLGIAFLAWIVGFCLAKMNLVTLVGSLKTTVPLEKQPYFIGNLWAHLSSYASGTIGGVILCLLILLRRLKQQEK